MTKARHLIVLFVLTTLNWFCLARAELPPKVKHYFKNGCFEEAKDYLTMLYQQNPSSREINNALARAYLFMAIKQLWKSGTKSDLKKIKSLLAVEKTDPIALYYLGKVELELKEQDAALACFQEAIKLDPAYTAAALDLALLYESQGQYKQARETVESLIKHISKSELRKIPRIKELFKRFSWEEGLSNIPKDLWPLNMIELPPGQTSLLVEKERQRLFLYTSSKNGLQLKQILPCTTGSNDSDKFKQGDNSTPEGVYFIEKCIEGPALKELGGDYGNMVFVLNYPNVFDQLLGKDGYGIWLHGTIHGLKPWLPQATRGCIVMNNIDLLEIAHAVHLRKTPIIITKKIIWVTPQEIQRWRKEIHSFLNRWRKAWENKDFATYDICYSPHFRSGKYDLKDWLEHKRLLAQKRKNIRISIHRTEIYFYNTYSNLGQVVMVRFIQDYASNDYHDRGLKTLFLVKGRKKTKWQILIEYWEPLS